MLHLLQNVLALVAGIVIGGAVKMALITISPSLVPPPPGVDVSNAESLSKAMPLFEPRHFIMPFLVHALGTFVGALVAYLIAATYKAQIAYAIGAVFLCGVS
jgi:large-conductance mechanosensitive channel